MVDVNQVVLIGRLTRDAELKYTTSGTAVCKFAVAVNRKKKDGDNWVDEPSFFDIVLWGRRGEALNQYLVKGKQVGVTGELRQERWQQDGQNRSKIEVVANSIQLLGGGNNSGGNGEGGNYGSGSNGGNSYGNNSGNAGRSGGSYGNGGGRNGGGAPQGYTRENSDGFTDDIPF